MTLDEIQQAKDFVHSLGLTTHRGGGVFLDNIVAWQYEIANIDPNSNPDHYVTLYHIKTDINNRPYCTTSGDHIYYLSEFKSQLLYSFNLYKKLKIQYKLKHMDKDFI